MSKLTIKIIGNVIIENSNLCKNSTKVTQNYKNVTATAHTVRGTHLKCTMTSFEYVSVSCPNETFSSSLREDAKGIHRCSMLSYQPE